MIDIVIIAIVLCILVGAALYVYKAKKNGEKCIGCPHSKQCGGKCSCDVKKTQRK